MAEGGAHTSAAWESSGGIELAGKAPWRRPGSWRRSLPALLLVGAILSTALLVPVLPLADPLATDYDALLQAPSRHHLLGTYNHGRDELSRVLWASRTSLLVGIVATALALAAGVAVGGLAAYGGRFLDPLLMRIADVFLSFPVILGAIAILAVFGPGRRNIFLAIAFFGWPVFARLFRSSVLSVRERDFVRASRVLGASRPRVFFRHVLPNAAPPLVTYSAMVVSAAILAEAGLSFIGLGVQPPYPSWGLMLAESMPFFESAPWLVLAPGAAVTMTALAFIFVGALVSMALEPGGGRRRR